MKTILLFLFVFATVHSSDPTTVYICGNKGTKKYHLNAHCRGLSSCSHKIIQTSLEKAKHSSMTLCGWEK